MSVTRILTAAACLGFLAGCGGSPAAPTGAASFEEALGLDQASINAREAKVQEAIRACMKAQGFDYVPIDPTQANISVSVAGVGGRTLGSDDPSFRRTKGYGITTLFGAERPAAEDPGRNDPNRAIRDRLSEADKEAYDRALYGDAEVGRDERPGGGVVIARRVGRDEPGGGPSERGCFGQAQQEVPGGPASLGDSLEELQQRIEGDPRLVQANQEWAACMAESGFDQFETPDEIPRYLIDELQELRGAPSSEEGGAAFAIGGDDIDQAALSRLQQEELTLARADDDCAKQTGRAKVEKQVREDAQQRFLDEHPELEAGS